jgi:hypothetical protein
MKSDADWQTIGLGIIIIAILGSISWALFHKITQAPWQFITILIASLGALITLAGNLQIQIRNDQKAKKFEIYEKVIKFFFDEFSETKLTKDRKTKDQKIEKFREIMSELALWASDDVLAIFIEFRQMSNEKVYPDKKVDPNALILLLGRLMLAMRKDFGYQNKGIDQKAILATFINDAENL